MKLVCHDSIFNDYCFYPIDACRDQIPIIIKYSITFYIVTKMKKARLTTLSSIRLGAELKVKLQNI